MNRKVPETINGRRVPYEKPTEELIGLLKDLDYPWSIYYALSQKADPAARKAILDATESADWRHRRMAAEALGSGRVDRRVLSRVWDLLDDESEYVVRTALDVISEHRIESARPRVIQLISSDDTETRRSAIRTLGVIAEEEDFSVLLSIFRSEGVEGVRREAGWALYQQSSAQNWRTLVDEWQDDPLHRHRVWACELVARFGGLADISVLDELKNDPDGHVRGAAERARSKVRERGGV